jgi:hypothetical protein
MPGDVEESAGNVAFELEVAETVASVRIILGGCMKGRARNCDTGRVTAYLWMPPMLGSEVLRV